MVRGSDGQPRKRFSRSGHTSHQPQPAPRHDVPPHRSAPPNQQPRNAVPPGYVTPPPNGIPPPNTIPPGYATPPGYSARAPEQPRSRPSAGFDSYGAPTYHQAGVPDAPSSPSRPAVALTKAAAVRTHKAARVVTRKVISASKSDGAEESGLTALIWNQVLSYGTDAMITVALAGTVFFGASTHAQRGNVLLYLLITMAPFAVVAPVIGPALDRLQHGRRWTMAGTAIGRAVLALIMAAHPTDLLVLYPCALGSLVLSKAYAVVRAAAAPRLVPEGMTLTSANARLSIFGLGSTLVLGGAIGIVIKITGSYSMGLWITAIGFAVCAFFAFRLPAQVDSAPDATRHPRPPARTPTQGRVAKLDRLRSWATRGFDACLVIALQGESALRLLSGLLTIYLAFYVESTTHGLEAAVQLGAVIGAAGVGNFAGTAIGTKLRMARPEAVIVASVAIAAGVCLVAAIAFSILFAVLSMFVSAVGNALSKIALDALIQRDVAERLRSSAFARSETFLQLAWVVGAAIGVLLPSKSRFGGAIGFWVAGVVLGVIAVVVILRLRAQRRGEPRDADPPAHPGSIDMRKIQPS